MTVFAALPLYVRNGSAIQGSVFKMFCGYAAGGVAAKILKGISGSERPSLSAHRVAKPQGSAQMRGCPGVRILPGFGAALPFYVRNAFAIQGLVLKYFAAEPQTT